MTTDTCIRGCTQFCTCESCSAGRVLHRPERVPATSGLLCSGCADRLWVTLHSIGVAYEDLDWSLVAPSERSEAKRAKVDTSPALVRLDVLALTDPRTRANTEDGLLYVPDEVGRLAALAWQQSGLEGPIFLPNLHSALWALVALWDDLVARPSIVAVFAALAHVARLLQADTEPAPAPVGRCAAVLEGEACKGALYQGDGTVACRRCNTHLTGLDLLRTALASTYTQPERIAA